MMQPDNGIHIKGWYHDTSDRELEKLIPFLKSLAVKRVHDVRQELRIYRSCAPY